MVFRFRNKRSGSIAKDRLKMILMSERMDCTPQMMAMLKNDMVTAINKYFTVKEHKVEIRFQKDGNFLLAKFPLRTDI